MLVSLGSPVVVLVEEADETVVGVSVGVVLGGGVELGGGLDGGDGLVVVGSGLGVAVLVGTGLMVLVGTGTIDVLLGDGLTDLIGTDGSATRGVVLEVGRGPGATCRLLLGADGDTVMVLSLPGMNTTLL
jgi:hypothetical protein